jgi:predicted acylesterase/phospholipase RssA
MNNELVVTPLAQFWLDHLPGNASSIMRTLLTISVAVVSAALAIGQAWEYLRRHETRRLLLLQRPPPVPMAPYNPIANDDSDYWLRELRTMPRSHRRPTTGTDAAVLASLRRTASLVELQESVQQDPVLAAAAAAAAVPISPAAPSGSKHANKPAQLISQKSMVFSSRAHQRLRPYRILSLDGGGVRGIVSATILLRLCKEFPTLLDSVDLIAGTSTGGLLCLLLAGGYSPRQCVDMYRFNAPIIFESYWLRKLLSPFNASYSDANKLDICRFYMGDRTLGQLNKHVVISAFRLDGGPEALGRATLFPVGKWRPCLFSNLPLGNGAVPPDMDLNCADAAMRTSAAPSYFPIYQGYVDGAVYANNPTIPALARVCSHFAPRVTLDNVIVLSLGCGMINQFIPREDCDAADWGLARWSPHLLDLLMDSGIMAADLHASLMLGERYMRCDPPLPEQCGLDDVTKIDTLSDFAAQVDLSHVVAWLETSGFIKGTESQEASVNSEPIPAKETISASSSSSSRRSGRRF